MRCDDTVVSLASPDVACVCDIYFQTLRGHAQCREDRYDPHNISVPTTRFAGTSTFTFPDTVLFADNRLFCFAMQSSPSFDRPDKRNLLQKNSLKKSLLEPTCGMSEHIGVYLPCINVSAFIENSQEAGGVKKLGKGSVNDDSNFSQL